MPIRPENRARYPADGPQISLRVRQRANNRCEFCGVKNGAIGGRLPDGTWLPAVPEESRLRLVWPRLGSVSTCGDRERGYAQLRIVRIVLTVAHLDHIPEHCNLDNLRALCQRCHLRYDQGHHAATARATRRARRALGDLFPETPGAAHG